MSLKRAPLPLSRLPARTPLVPRVVLLWLGLGIVATALLLAGHRLVDLLEMLFAAQASAAGHMLDHPALFAILLAYAVLLACPFVPGAELGLIVLVVCGADAAGYVYLATVLGLLAAFSVGRLVPLARLRRGLRALGLARIADRLVPGVEDSRPLPLRLGLGDLLSRRRYLLLGLAFNLPGNTILGGGGGLAMAAGASRRMTAPAFALTVATAVAPVPLFFVLAPRLIG